MNEIVVVSTLSGGIFDHTLDINKRVYSVYGIAPTIRACLDNTFDKAIKVKYEERNKTNTMVTHLSK